MNIVHLTDHREPIGLSPSRTRADQIVAEARTLFAQSGYESTSIAAIARAVGVVDGAIYRHFDSKREILHAVIAGFYQPLVASAVELLGQIPDPQDRLTALVRRNLTAYAEDPLVCRLIIAEARVLDGYFESTVADLSRRYTSLATDAVRDGMATGVFRNDLAPTVVRDILFGAMEHMAWAALTGHSSLDIESATQSLMSIVLRGTLTQPAPDQVRLGQQIDRLETLLSRYETGGRPQ